MAQLSGAVAHYEIMLHDKKGMKKWTVVTSSKLQVRPPPSAAAPGSSGISRLIVR